MEKGETKIGSSKWGPAEKRSWFEFCQSRCKGFMSSEEMKEMQDCCGDATAQEKKGWNWQEFCSCMPSEKQAGTEKA